MAKSTFYLTSISSNTHAISTYSNKILYHHTISFRDWSFEKLKKICNDNPGSNSIVLWPEHVAISRSRCSAFRSSDWWTCWQTVPLCTQWVINWTDLNFIMESSWRVLQEEANSLHHTRGHGSHSWCALHAAWQAIHTWPAWMLLYPNRHLQEKSIW